MVVACAVGNALECSEIPKDVTAFGRMRLDNSALLRCQGPSLVENVIRNANLTNVVQKRNIVGSLLVTFVIPHTAGEFP